MDKMLVERKMLAERTEIDNSFRFYPKYNRILKFMSSIFIQDIIGRAGLAIIEGKMSKDNFFPCSVKSLTDYWTVAQQRLYFKRMEDLKYLETKYIKKDKGPGRTRWVRIRLIELEKDAQQAKTKPKKKVKRR